MHYDAFGLIVQKDGDGGDTAQREGWAWFGSWIREKVLQNPWELQLPISLDQTIALLEVGQTGQFRRHPPGKGLPDWWSEPDRFSRDQQVPLIAAFGVWDQRATVDRMHKALRSLPFLPMVQFVQGTHDIASPDHLNLFRRALGEAPDEIGDIQLAGSVGTRLLVASRTPNDVGDDLNLIVSLLMAHLVSPSAVSEEALNAYRKNRPVCSGCFLTSYRNAYPNDTSADEATMARRIEIGRASGWAPDCPRVLGALRWYFRAETGANPELAELYGPIVDKYLT